MDMIPILAYIDAGTGSLVFQAAAAGAIAAAVFFRQIRSWLSVRLCRVRRESRRNGR